MRLYFRLCPGQKIDADQVIAFLKNLNPELGAGWRPIWDRLNAHRANKTRAYIDTVSRLHPFFFPAYAPELNAIEYLWSWLKMNPMANRAIHDMQPLAQATCP